MFPSTKVLKQYILTETDSEKDTDFKKKTPNGGFIDGCSHQVIGPGISQCLANHDTIKMMEFVEMMDML